MVKAVFVDLTRSCDYCEHFEESKPSDGISCPVDWSGETCYKAEEIKEEATKLLKAAGEQHGCEWLQYSHSVDDLEDYEIPFKYKYFLKIWEKLGWDDDNYYDGCFLVLANKCPFYEPNKKFLKNYQDALKKESILIKERII
jgi:hypothetical protein